MQEKLQPPEISQTAFPRASDSLRGRMSLNKVPGWGRGSVKVHCPVQQGRSGERSGDNSWVQQGWTISGKCLLHRAGAGAAPRASAQQRSFVTPATPLLPKLRHFRFCASIWSRGMWVHKALGVFQGHSARIPSLHKPSRTWGQDVPMSQLALAFVPLKLWSEMELPSPSPHPSEMTTHTNLFNRAERSRTQDAPTPPVSSPHLPPLYYAPM